MKKISHKERKRILELHHKTPMKPYLFEHNGLLKKIQAQTDASLTSNKIYDKTNTPAQIPKQTLSQNQVNAIKQYVADYASREIPIWPFKNNGEGDYFRRWVNSTFPKLADFLKLDKNGKYYDSYYNDFIKKAWNYPLRIGAHEKKLGDWYVILLTYDNNMPKFYQRCLTAFEKAKEWWRNWLNNPNTRIRFKKLNDWFLDSSVNKTFNKYLIAINNMNIYIYHDYIGDDGNIHNYNGADGGGCEGAQACVHRNDLTKINVNVRYSDLSDIDLESIITHEIQHILYFIFPMTPNESITQFKSSDNCYKKNREIYNNVNITKKDEKILGELKIDDKKLNLIAADLGVDFKKTKNIVLSLLRTTYAGWDENYLRTQDSELLSRIGGSRNLLLKGKNRDYLKKEDFVNYLINDLMNDKTGQIMYVMTHWAAKGFPPLESFANELNTSIVKADQKNIKNSRINKYLPQQSNKIDPNSVV